MARRRERLIEKRTLGILLWIITALLLVFYFLKILEYRNRDVLYVLLSVVTSGAATSCMPLAKKKELTALLWFYLFCDFFLRAAVYGRADFFEYTILEADARRVEWFISQKVNLVPFRTIGLFADVAHKSTHAFINLVGNVILFVPCTFLFPFVFPRTARSFRGSAFWLPLLFGFCFSLAVELLQLFFMCGAPDVDDLILNTLGGALGAFAAAEMIALKAQRSA